MSNIPVVSGGIFNFTIGGYTPPHLAEVYMILLQNLLIVYGH